MKVAIPHWQGRISPVFDVAGNVLVVEGLKGLVAGAKWAGDVKQIRRFGGMPVIGYLPGAPGALGAIDWKLVTLRASDKTWEKIKSVLNIDVLRAGLR